MTVSESRIDFEFRKSYTDVVKYDETDYYREEFSAQSSCKGVDFLALSQSHLLLLEVKNCFGSEAENRWRIENNNAKRDTIPGARDLSSRDSLDIEVAEKTRMTIAALAGVHTRPKPAAKLEACEPFSDALCSDAIGNERIKLVVILLLDGSFGCRTRDDKLIRMKIQQSIQKKLKWLNCTVVVTDSDNLDKARIGVCAHRA